MRVKRRIGKFFRKLGFGKKKHHSVEQHDEGGSDVAESNSAVSEQIAQQVEQPPKAPPTP